ncbi:MAG: SEL1-like repeat protein [candidate division NC10 bacterium]|nr:SEL1-like repeat protein [candidate division NC10 bacterium]
MFPVQSVIRTGRQSLGELDQSHRKAAAQGVLGAQLLLGGLYYDGVEGVPADRAEAARWYDRAAGQGEIHAQLMAGWMRYIGDGIPRDAATALRWFRRAAEQGNVQGQVMLGTAYLEDHTPYRNPEEALAWLARAAERGDTGAQFLAGSLFLAMQAPGVEPAQAARWLQGAARQGRSEASKALAVLCKDIPDACADRIAPSGTPPAGRVVSSLPTTARPDSPPAGALDPRSVLALFSQAFSLIQSSSVDAVDPQILLHAAIHAMLQRVDPQGAVMPSDILTATGAGQAGGGGPEPLKAFAAALAWIQARYGSAVRPEDAVHAAIRGMMEKADPHGSFIPTTEMKELRSEIRADFGGIGVELIRQAGELTVVAPSDGGPADRAGIRSGDRILRIGGESTAGMTLGSAVAKLRGPTGSQVTLSLSRAGRADTVDVRLQREPIELKSVQSQPLGDGMHYIRIGSFTEQTLQDLQQELQRIQADGGAGLVMDLRNNGGGLLKQAVAVSDIFLDAGQLIAYTKGRRKNPDLRFVAEHAGGFSKLPMVVLVNHGTASGAEIVAAALQDWKRAVILGEPTFGRGSIQTLIPLSDGSGLLLTTAKFFTPLGRYIGEVGITPDVVVKEPQPESTPGGLARLSRWKPGDVASDRQLQHAMVILRSRN